MEKLLTVRQAAEALNVSIRTVRRWLRAGKIPGARRIPGRFGGEWRIPESVILGIEATEADVVEVPDMLTCQGVRADGEPCNAPVVKGTRYCRHHQDQAEEGAR